MSNLAATEIVSFWREAGPVRWWEKNDEFDGLVRSTFLPLHEAAARGELAAWEDSPEGALALVILLDQFPRNMFRRSPHAFATDPLAHAVAERAILRDFDAGGIEPLEADLDRFLILFRGRKTPIKSALLNQKLLRGVGNIYADESLFRAGIRPRRRASNITRDQLARLLASVKEVLEEAIALGGSSISDYVDAEGRRGFFQFEHRVYQRTGEPCLTCGAPIRRTLVAQRGTHYCPKCQRR